MTVNLRDDNCGEVKVPINPSRIVSLSPAITETLFSLGCGNKVVGVTPYCVRPPAATKIKKIASYGYARTDLLRELEPDLILTVTGYQDKVANELKKNFEVYSFRLPATLSGVIDLFVKVGLVTGRLDEGRQLARDMLSRINLLRLENIGSAYIELDLGGPVTFGSLSYITDVLAFVGLKNIYGEFQKEWITPDFDLVAKKDPDIIILEPKMFSKRDENYVDKIVSERGWSGIKSHRNKHIYVTPGPNDFFAHHGPSLITEVLPWLKEQLTR